ncbi:MAG: pectate lyase precursor, partial [Candidatus Glassbacteria bacterium]|nr:pectate lyase precursor [Candidatus Glassbacteria bacterium]
MKLQKPYLALACCLLLTAQVMSTPALAEEITDSLPCFPGAGGWGAFTPGGRGGRVILVTSLDTTGPGSLQEACSAEGPRIVVFAVGGVIPGPVAIEHGRITIAGQTAPSPGITIRGTLGTRPLGAKELEDIVVRFLRVRPDQDTSYPGHDADAVHFDNCRRCVLDHVSCSWANDETLAIYSARETTVQWCTIEESDTVGHHKGHQHNYGMISGPEGGPVSIHHNLFAHHRRRCPAVANGPSDIRNNVVYNFRDGFLHDNEPNDLGFNIIGNYYKAGPSEDNIHPFCFVDSTPYYLRDNFVEGVGLIQDPWAEKDKLRGFEYYSGFGVRAAAEYAVPQVATYPPQQACELVLKGAGCFPRDTLTRRTVAEVRAGTGSWGRNDPGD